MTVCVVGWHFHRPLYETLRESKYPWTIVAHRKPPDDLSFPGPQCRVLLHNIGLEFHCYDDYLRSDWVNSRGSVLFSHDDNEITEAALDTIAALDRDQAFLFSSDADAQANGKAHGRAIFCSERFLTRLKADGGFWYDERPCDGKPIPATTADAPDFHNAAIQVFRAYLERLPQDEFRVNQVAIIPGLKTGYRGRL